MAAAVAQPVRFRATGVSGTYDVEIDGTVRGFVTREDDGWQAWAYVGGDCARQLRRSAVKAGVPYVTRREAGDEVLIQAEGA